MRIILRVLDDVGCSVERPGIVCGRDPAAVAKETGEVGACCPTHANRYTVRKFIFKHKSFHYILFVKIH